MCHGRGAVIGAAAVALAVVVGSGQQVEAEPLVRHGQVVAEDLALAMEGLVLSLETSEGDDFEDALTRLRRGPDFASYRWTRVGEVPIDEDGGFRVRIPADAPHARLVARGRFALGIHAFRVNGYADPGAEPLDLPLSIGGEIRLRLRIDGDVDGASLRDLVGRTMTVAGDPGWWGPVVENWPREVGGLREAIVRTGVIGADLVVTFPRVPELDMVIEQRSGASRLWNEPAVAPFCVPPGLRLRPIPGRSRTVDVTLREGVTFSGQVVSAEGEPVVGATVRTGSSLGTRATEEVRATVTDAEGRFTLRGLTRTPETIVHWHEDFVTGGVHLGDPGTAMGADGVRLVVQRWRSLTVRVVTPDGRPAAGLLLAMTDPADDVIGPVRARTDRGGVARFERLSGAPVTVTGTGGRLECEARGVDPANGPLELRLAPVVRTADPVDAGYDPGPRAAMVGSLADADGAPLPGVTVHITRRAAGRSPERSRAVTDGTGVFRSPPLLAGRYSLSAAFEDPTLRAWLPDVAFDPEAGDHVTLPVTRLGQVVLSSEAGLDRVRLARTSGSPRWLPVRWERSDARSERPWDGRLRPLLPGPHLFAFEVIHPDGSVTMRPVEVQVPAGGPTKVTLEEPTAPLAELVGRVRSGDTPIPGIRIRARAQGHDMASALTDTEGRFHLRVDADGPLTLRLGDDGSPHVLERATRARRAVREELDLRLPTGSVRVRLDHPLVAGETVRLRRLGAPERELPTRLGGGQGSRGVTFHFVEDGRYAVEFLGVDQEVTAGAEAVVDGDESTVHFGD